MLNGAYFAKIEVRVDPHVGPGFRPDVRAEARTHMSNFVMLQKYEGIKRDAGALSGILEPFLPHERPIEVFALVQ